MPNDEQQELRLLARDAMRRQLIPTVRPERTWGGPGSGDTCKICKQALRTDEMVFDVEIADDGSTHGALNFQLHVRCLKAWELERPRENREYALRPTHDEPTLQSSDRDNSNAGRRP